MKAITLWQPWASAIALRQKRNETRSWATRYRGRLAIHAAVRQHRDDEAFFAEAMKELHTTEYEAWSEYCDTMYHSLPFGEIVATCRLVNCIRVEDAKPSALERLWGNYEAGRYAWILDEVQMLPTPIPATGHQGFWEWETDQPILSTVQLSLL